MKTLRVALRMVSCQRANALPTGNVMGKMEWATFRRSQCRWPRRCWPHWVVANGGNVSASSPVSKWRGVRRMAAEHVTESVWTEPEPPKSAQSSETSGGLCVPIWIESARVRDMCCGRTPSGGERCWSLNHAGWAVAWGLRGLTTRANGWPESHARGTSAAPLCTSAACLAPFAESERLHRAFTPPVTPWVPPEGRGRARIEKWIALVDSLVCVHLSVGGVSPGTWGQVPGLSGRGPWQPREQSLSDRDSRRRHCIGDVPEGRDDHDCRRLRVAAWVGSDHRCGRGSAGQVRRRPGWRRRHWGRRGGSNPFE